MDDFAIRSLESGLVGPLASQADSPTLPTTQGLDFQTLLTTLLTSSSLGNSSNDNPFAGDLMMPVLISLIEKLAAQEQGWGNTLTRSSLSPTIHLPESTVPGTIALPAAYQQQPSAPQGTPLTGPLTQGYHPGHHGLDFGVVVGTQVHATMGGKVIYAGWNEQGYGNLVIVENGPYQTYYAHLSEIPVSLGQSVDAGQVIGLSGNTGHSTGPHLHYEVRYDEKAIDPTSFTLGSGSLGSVSG